MKGALGWMEVRKRIAASMPTAVALALAAAALDEVDSVALVERLLLVYELP